MSEKAECPRCNAYVSQALTRCHRLIEIPSTYCLNVAVTGSIVLYDRAAKAAA